VGVTIVSAAGTDAYHGLPGIRAFTRYQEQEIFRVNGVPLLQALDPPGDGIRWSYLSDSKWNTRGWTFQETILSDRLLIFTAEQVYWECHNGSWCEDGFWEQHLASNKPAIHRTIFDLDEHFHSVWIQN